MLLEIGRRTRMVKISRYGSMQRESVQVEFANVTVPWTNLAQHEKIV